MGFTGEGRNSFDGPSLQSVSLLVAIFRPTILRHPISVRHVAELKRTKIA